jgi:hypothetical protein
MAIVKIIGCVLKIIIVCRSVYRIGGGLYCYCYIMRIKKKPVLSSNKELLVSRSKYLFDSTEHDLKSNQIKYFFSFSSQYNNGNTYVHIIQCLDA